jgi:2-iminobutanoate/2-iminopropanoate deaminase
MKKSLPLLILLFTFFISSCNNPPQEKKAIYLQTDEFAKFDFPFCEAVKYGDMLYLSGQVGEIMETGKLVEGGIIPETNQTMQNIKTVLEQNGSSLDNVIKCTCMLADINDWAAMSKEYVKYFPNHRPARSAFGTTGLALGSKVEIECMAYIKN